MKKILVTGGAGFIGSHIVDKLIEMKNDVIVIDNLSSDAHEQFYYNKLATYYKYDIRDFDTILPLFKDIDYVFHLAAESRIQPAIEDPTYAIEVNTAGTCNVLQAARVHNIKRVMYSSTSAAYGLNNKPPVNEDMLVDCLNPYSISKCAGEDLCKMYTNLFGLDTVSFRYFNVYGDRQPLQGQYAPVIGLFLKQKENNQPMTIVGNGEQTRDFTHVSDVVAANIAAMQTELGGGEVYNVGTGTSYTILEIASIIGGNYTFIPERPGECRYISADNSKINNKLNWQPTVNLRNWINNYKTKTI